MRAVGLLGASTALVLVATSAAAHAFETVVKVISVSPAKEIVNEPYESCQPDAERPGEQVCHQTDHYDMRTMYTVVYEYQGQLFSAKLRYDPGSELRVNVSVTPK